MIKNLVFDMGNVLIHWKGDLLMDWMGITDEEDRILLKEKMFSSYEWPLLDWGDIVEEEAERIFSSRLPERLHSAVHSSLYWYDMIHPVDGMGEYIAQKKSQGYSVYLLSNAPALVRRYFSRIPGSAFFDGIIFSGEVAMVKPMPEIYRLLLGRYSLEAGECLFTDDLPINVAAAVREGMKGLVFHHDPDEIERFLETLRS